MDLTIIFSIISGGEISCNAVTCYIRHDCEPKYIAGRCCPEYDNCPPLDQVKHTSTTTENSIISPNQSETNDKKTNPLGISIKEITKPGEIRFPKEKPKTNLKASNGNGTLPIQTKELTNQVTTTNTNENLVESSDSESTQSSIVTRANKPDADRAGPSVVHIGDKALILDKNSPSPSITVVGVEGLQLGEEFDDHEKSTDFNLTSLVNATDIEDSMYDESNFTYIYDNSTNESWSKMYGNENFIDDNNYTLSSTLNYISSSTEYYPDNYYNISDYNATNNYDEDHVASSSDTIQVLATFNDTFYENGNDSSLANNDDEDNNEALPPHSVSFGGETNLHSTNSKPYVEDDDAPQHELISPGHPSIPDDFAILGRDQELVALDQDSYSHAHTRKSEQKILESILSLRANASVEQSLSTNNDAHISHDWLKVDTTTPLDTSFMSTDDQNLRTYLSSREDSGSGSGAGSDIITLNSKPTISLDDTMESSSPVDDIVTDEYMLLPTAYSSTVALEH